MKARFGRVAGRPATRWSENVKPIVGTDSAKLPTSATWSGRMRVFMDNGTEGEVGRGV